MQTQLFGIVILAVIALCTAFPTFLMENEGQQYQLTPVLSRQRREDPIGFAEGNGNRGYAGFRNPDGSGGSVGYSNQNGYGQTVSIDAMVPVWSHKGPNSESNLNIGGGTTQHFGGPFGNENLQTRVGFSFIHRW